MCIRDRGAPAQAARPTPPPRPAGPCDIYAAAGDPCVAAHSTTRAMYASYNGPLYQVMRLSDNALKDIGVVAPVAKPFPAAGGYADAAAQDASAYPPASGNGVATGATTPMSLSALSDRRMTW